MYGIIHVAVYLTPRELRHVHLLLDLSTEVVQVHVLGLVLEIVTCTVAE